MHRFTKGIALSISLASLATACGGSDEGVMDGVDALVILQRAARNEMGDIFQYTSYLPGAKIVQLSPPTADGVQTTICCDQDPDFATADISGYDLSFDANIVDGVRKGQMVFSAKLDGSTPYALFVMSLETGQIDQLYGDPGRDFTMPIFLAGGKVMFMSNSVVEGQGSPQFQDEYERGTTLQLGVVNLDGTGEVLGARNLSHRVYPNALSNGRVIFTQWDHLAGMNAGHLMQVNPDMTQMREAFGKEGSGVQNSFLKAVEVSPGRLLAIGTSRDRTIQSGKVLDIRMGMPRTLERDEIINNVTWAKGTVVADQQMSEANATFRDYTPDVPGDREPSLQTVGRYYDAYPLNGKDYPDILVSWADGPVESGTLGAAGLNADFGVYLYDTKHGTRLPILNTVGMWDIFPRPLRPRGAPLDIAATQPDQNAGLGVLIGSMNAYNSTIAPDLAQGSIYGVRVIEGFSSEEGFPMDFSTVETEGAAHLGIAPLADDNSWAAVVPANVPVHVQLVNQYGVSQVNEPVWTSGRPGEARICGGCHEDRTSSPPQQPGLLHAVAQGPVTMYQDVPRFTGGPNGQGRMSLDYSRDKVMGVPWDRAVQPVFDDKCIACHGAGSTNGWEVQLVDEATGTAVNFSFELTGDPVNITIGELMITGYSKSYISMAGFMMEDLEEANITIVPVRGTYVPGMLPQDYQHSHTHDLLNPVKQYPTPDLAVREIQPSDALFDAQHSGLGLSADQHFLLQLSADMGLQWFARENKP